MQPETSLSRRTFLKTSALALTLPFFGSAKFKRAARPNAESVVLIIGAGISGLGAARQLIDEFGFAPNQIIVLEARNRIGGRIYTDHSLGYPVDMGAMWIHGVNGNPIAALAQRYGAQLFQSNYESEPVFDSDGSPVSDADYDRLYARYRKVMKQFKIYRKTLKTDQSVARSLQLLRANANLTALDRRVMSWIYFTEIALDYNLPLQQLSSQSMDQDEIFDGPDKIFMNGYDTIVNGLANGLDVRLNHVVESIGHDGMGTVKVSTNQGTLTATHCIVTLPLGVLKSGAVEFTPALPAPIQSAIHKLGFGRLYKHALVFDSQFWGNDEFFGKIGQTTGKFGKGSHIEFVNDAPISGQPLLIAFALDAFAVELEAMSENAATARLMQDVRAIFGQSVPNPIASLRSDFIGSPFTRGGYSYWATHSTPQDVDAFTNSVDNQLFFAGEHTHSLYPQTVHGAYLSGCAAARRLANSI